MGLLKDAIGSALGANQPNNGLGGPTTSWKSRNSSTRSSYRPSYDYNDYQPYRSQGYTNQDAYYRAYDSQDYSDGSYIDQEPPSYNEYTAESTAYTHGLRPQRPSNYSFQPIGLPQIAYGDGQPFLRGYNSQLARHGISEIDFIQVVDALNVAIIPNPENQIFQKGASIAGWFVPGVASIGLIAGQIGVGIGAAYGHAGSVARTLSKANLEMFLPRGLEICIMSTQNVDSIFGRSPHSTRSNQSFVGVTPESKFAAYRGLFAPLAMVLPPSTKSGRNDPIAMLGRHFGEKSTRKKVEDAEKDAREGKRGKDTYVKWPVVRTASQQALSYLDKERRQNRRVQEVESR